MGYSLGGRLALHALIDQPKLWKGAIIVSAHPGLISSKEREERLKQDKVWAERFFFEEWGSLIASWNSRSAFSADSFHFIRKESDYQRKLLAQQIVSFSLGHQEDLRQKIAQLFLPLLWITGAEDLPYSKVATEVSFKHPLSRRSSIPHAGHRTPWAQTERFRQEIERFIKYATSS